MNIQEEINDGIRYVISHIDKSEMRAMTFAQQGRETKGSKKEAEQALRYLLTNNTETMLASIFGSQSIGTFEVSAIECYPNHHDPKGCYIREELNPGQMCFVGKMKKIFNKLKQ